MDSRKNEVAVPTASVTLLLPKSEEHEKITLEAITSAKGEFTIKGVRFAGNYSLVIEKEGFDKYEGNIIIAEGDLGLDKRIEESYKLVEHNKIVYRFHVYDKEGNPLDNVDYKNGKLHLYYRPDSSVPGVEYTKGVIEKGAEPGEYLYKYVWDDGYFWPVVDKDE